MAQPPVDPMKTKLQRDWSSIQKTPQQFSEFCFADADDKFRPFLKASKLPSDWSMDSSLVASSSAVRSISN